MLNDVTLIGRLANEPEIRKTSNGSANVKFRLACDRNYSSNDGTTVDFIPVVLWGKNAENTSLYCKKGSLVAIKGSIRTGKYDKDGVTYYTMEVVGNRISFLSSRQDNRSQFEESDLVDDESFDLDSDIQL